METIYFWNTQFSKTSRRRGWIIFLDLGHAPILNYGYLKKKKWLKKHLYASYIIGIAVYKFGASLHLRLR